MPALLPPAKRLLLLEVSPPTVFYGTRQRRIIFADRCRWGLLEVEVQPLYILRPVFFHVEG